MRLDNARPCHTYIWFPFVALLTGALIAVLVAPGTAWAQNTNPIDWTISSSYVGHLGNDVPLRVGQLDHPNRDGFGVRHIQQQHGAVPPDFDIQDTVSGPGCVQGPDERFRCFNDETLLFVVYSPGSDSRSGDGRPFGIITAFYQLPCLAQSLLQTDPCGEVTPVPTTLTYTGPGQVSGGEVSLSAVLTDDLGIPVTGRTIQFTATGTSGCSATTDTAGTGRCVVDVGSTSGSLTVQVTFAGDTGFLPSDSTAQVVVDTPPEVDAGPDRSGEEGAPVSLAGSATDDRGIASVSWSYEAGPDVDAGAECTFDDPGAASTTLVCSDDGTFTVTLSATDGVNPPVSDAATVSLSNVAPQVDITDPAPWTAGPVSRPVSLTAPFTDPGTNDTHVCDIDWDDGTTDSFDGLQNCSQTHAYSHPGMYTVRVTVTDDDGGVDSASVLVVVYDPDGPWANANGSFDSPAGALSGDPDSAGETWFHLAARYYPQNVTRPAGSAQIWLPDTDFRFMTDLGTADWLVVTPDGKIVVKGSGTLAGQPGRYGFVFYGFDGCAAGSTSGCQPGPDAFRAVVWPLAAGSYPDQSIWYDSHPGDGYDVDDVSPADLLSGEVLIEQPS